MKSKESKEAPEFTRFTRYYEHDGMLRAYANRAMFLAILFAMIAFGSLGFAIYVRVQPPTVIRVDKEGNAVVVDEVQKNPVSQLELALAGQAASPDANSSDGE